MFEQRKVWTISHGNDGWHAELLSRPWWLSIVEALGNLVITLTFHRVCCKMPEWSWRVPVGRPRYDHSDFDENGKPWLENSLADLLWRVGQSLSMPFWRHEQRLVKCPITEEQARVLSPRWVDEYLEMMRHDELDDPAWSGFLKGYP